MPGILPMKVIKVGTSAQSRIAQACDRCRSKKIRCDGVTPCCSQCSNVGFECKTSDKLSRRAFPRGYTESLEERVRALELETRELKDLLDEKDEKIDMLSRIHSFSPSHRPSQTSVSSGLASQSPLEQEKEDLFKIQQASCLLEGENESEPYFMGPSSGRGFIDAFKTKIHESGRSSATFDTKDFFSGSQKPLPKTTNLSELPPRVVSDQLINIFFQEWAPLFPALHRPTFLKIYADYSTDPEGLKDPHSIAQLNLIFGTAALASQSRTELLDSYEAQWQSALDNVIGQNSLPTLQCLILAQIHSIAKGDYSCLLKYRGIAVNMSSRLGLHQSQKRFSLGALTLETRKKVFWSLYTLDCFTAAQLGLPMLMKDGEIETEEPADVDDENVTERGFQPILPGESTKISSALALFRVAKVLSKVLVEEYPAVSSHDISLQRVLELGDDLDAWREELAPHLRLEFAHDKPSTNVVSSRSPLLALAYYYIRSLIHRPVISSGLGAKASPSVVALADSSKHIVQILQLLKERHLSFTMCLNKSELLALSGFGILSQQLELKADGRLIRENQQLAYSIIELLQCSSEPMSIIFRKVAFSLLPSDQFTKPVSRRKSSLSTDNSMSAPKIPHNNHKSQLQAITSRLSLNISRAPKLESRSQRRSIGSQNPIPNNLAMYSRAGSQASQCSLSSIASEPTANTTASELSPKSNSNHFFSGSTHDLPNLDYLPLNSLPTPKPRHQSSKRPSIYTPSASSSNPDWENLGGCYFPTSNSSMSAACDSQNAVSGFSSGGGGSGDSTTGPADYVSPDALSFASPTLDWSPEAWSLLDGASAHEMQNGGGGSTGAAAQSVFSLSEDSLGSSGEDIGGSAGDYRSELRGFAMPSGEDFLLEELGAGLRV